MEDLDKYEEYDYELTGKRMMFDMILKSNRLMVISDILFNAILFGTFTFIVFLCIRVSTDVRWALLMIIPCFCSRLYSPSFMGDDDEYNDSNDKED